MALEKTAKMIATFHATMMVANTVTEDLQELSSPDNLAKKPVQALYAAKYALILYSMAAIAESYLEEITKHDHPLVAEAELEPLVVSLDNAIHSIDTSLQVSGLDIGLKEEWLKC